LPKLNVAPTNKFLRRLTGLGIIGAFQIEAALEVPVLSNDEAYIVARPPVCAVLQWLLRRL